MTTSRRVAIFGMFLESNSFSNPVTEAVFRSTLYLEGDDATREARVEAPRLMKEAVGFYRRMDELGEWEPVPILITSGSTGGPVDHRFFEETMARIRQGLEDKLPVDAVYICNHGAMTTTKFDDPEGSLYEMARDVVGPDIPIVATLDPHGNIAQRSIDSVDVFVSYRTDPHTDHAARGAEAADVLYELWPGMTPHVFNIRLPIVPPNVSLFSDSGPFADLVKLGQSRMTDDIVNVSICGGFAFSDTSKNGLHVVVTGRNKSLPAARLCTDIAELGWRNRDRFVCEAISIDQAVEHAREVTRNPNAAPVIFADLGDNCGAGGPANTIWMLEALHAASVEDYLIANFCDPALVEEAFKVGPGAEFDAAFTGDTWAREDDGKFYARAKVLSLHDGHCVGRRGITVGRSMYAGPMCLLRVGGLFVTVTTRRQQCTDPIFVEMMGVDISRLRGLVVKLRAAFRVAFDEFFARENMIQVDTPGRTSPMLARHDWRRLPRPVYPIDGPFEWHVPQLVEKGTL